jgi:hypothetical protein
MKLLTSPKLRGFLGEDCWTDKDSANPPQIRQWIHQVFVWNHLARPLRACCPTHGSSPFRFLIKHPTSDILTSSMTCMNIFQFMLFAAKFGYIDRALTSGL